MNRFTRLSIVAVVVSIGMLGVADTATAAVDKPPTVPQALTADSITSTSATLHWLASTDNVRVDHYDVARRTAFGTAILGQTSALAFPLTGLTQRTTYGYVVRASDGKKNSAWSTRVLFTTPATPKPVPVPVPPTPTPTPVLVPPTTVAWTNCVNGYVALTFDDGPSTSSTVALVAELKKYQIKATFYDVGEHVTSNPELARLAATQGDVQNHSWDHSSASGASTGTAPMSLQGSRDELSMTTAAIVAAGLPAPTQFRPPYGDTTDNLRIAESEQGLTEIGWTTDTNDWQNPGTSVIAERALAADPGGIVLMHDQMPTVAAVAQISSGLVAQGRCPGRVSYSPTPQNVWSGWDFNGMATAW
jgi:peptidoglycan/xylan/chitin deacetylase (PgdA/CDA1 family)